MITEAQLKNAFLRQRQSLPIRVKIEMTWRRIRQWYEMWDGNVHVSFSGGADSTVLLWLVRILYPHVPAVFVDTGMEFPEIREFVRSVDNVVWLRPRKTFKVVCEEYGYPVVSKDVSMALDRHRNTKSDVQRALRLNPGVNPNNGKYQSKGVIPRSYHYLISAPFKCSERCCYFLKKQPIMAWERTTGSKAFVGIMAVDSKNRRDEIMKNGCNSFNAAKPVSRPLAFWTAEDIKQLLSLIPHSTIYDKGYDHTGCMFCLFGVQEEMRKTGTNRFQLMKKTHPRLHAKGLPAFGIDKVLDYMGVPYE